MNDLSKQSQALTNTLMPRNPIVPRNKKYQQHSEFGFSINDQNLKKRYKDLISQNQRNSPSSFQMSPNSMHKKGRKSMMNGTHGLFNHQIYPALDSKKKHIPFHQKRATMDVSGNGIPFEIR